VVILAGCPSAGCPSGTDGGQGEVGIDTCLAAFRAAAQLAEVVEPGVRALDHPPFTDLDRCRCPALGDLGEQSAFLECLPAGR